MKRLFNARKLVLGLGVLLVFSGCAAPTPTITPFPTTNYETPIALPTFTPYPLDDPALADLKALLKKAADTKDRTLLQNTASFTKWVGAIYRQGGTPPIDPPRGLTMTLNFLQESPVTMDLLRPTHEPVWSQPPGDTSVLALVTPTDGTEPFYAHFYIQREPSAWRFTGIMTRIPYYDAPSVAQLRAAPNQYADKEFMYVGTYQPAAKPPANAGTPPDAAAFALETFSGPLWTVLSQEPYVIPLPADADAMTGQTVRVFGTVKINNGAPFLLIDSFEVVKPDSWAHSGGVIESIDAKTRRVNLKATGSSASVLQLTETSFISLADGTREKLDALKSGQFVDATGVPQKDGSLLVEELFVK